LSARLEATNSTSMTLTRHALPAPEAALPTTLGYELLARRPDLQAAHWYIEASMSEVDAAERLSIPMNLMAFYNRMPCI
jgi:outer membrane protein TolC